MKEIRSVNKLKMYFRRAKESAVVGKYIGDKQLKAIAKSMMTYPLMEMWLEVYWPTFKASKY